MYCKESRLKALGSNRRMLLGGACSLKAAVGQNPLSASPRSALSTSFSGQWPDLHSATLLSSTNNNQLFARNCTRCHGCLRPLGRLEQVLDISTLRHRRVSKRHFWDTGTCTVSRLPVYLRLHIQDTVQDLDRVLRQISNNSRWFRSPNHSGHCNAFSSWPCCSVSTVLEVAPSICGGMLGNFRLVRFCSFMVITSLPIAIWRSRRVGAVVAVAHAKYVLITTSLRNPQQAIGNSMAPLCFQPNARRLWPFSILFCVWVAVVLLAPSFLGATATVHLACVVVDPYFKPVGFSSAATNLAKCQS